MVWKIIGFNIREFAKIYNYCPIRQSTNKTHATDRLSYPKIEHFNYILSLRLIQNLMNSNGYTFIFYGEEIKIQFHWNVKHSIDPSYRFSWNEIVSRLLYKDWTYIRYIDLSTNIQSNLLSIIDIMNSQFSPFWKN